MTKTYQVIKPVGFAGRREIGEMLELTDDEARNIGDEFVKLVPDQEEGSDEAESAKTDEPADEHEPDKEEEHKEVAPESAPATAGDNVEDKDGVNHDNG
jgi:hypothetical protein